MKPFSLMAILAFCLALNLTACGGGGDDDNDDSATNSDGTSSDESVYITGSFDGELDASDNEVFPDSAYAELVTINDVPAGVTMEIIVESYEFDPIATLYWNWGQWDADGYLVAEGDDNHDDSNSFIFATTSKAGDYTILVTSSYYGREPGTGPYTVRWYIYTDNFEDDFEDTDESDDGFSDDEDTSSSDSSSSDDDTCHSKECGSACAHFNYVLCACQYDFWCVVTPGQN